MKKRITAVLTLIIFCVSTFFLTSVRAYAYTNSSYFNPIKIGLTRVSGSSVRVTTTGDYAVNGQILPSGTSYTVTMSGGYVDFNGRLYSEISLVPQQSGNYLTLSASGNTLSYLGTITFKINSGEITPINTIDIEDYLMGVVGHEMYPFYDLEALKAQAVAARTYALSELGEYSAYGYDLTDSTTCQVYYGYEPSLYSEYPNVVNAVLQTKGQVLTYNNNLINAYYSASDGGYTEAPQNVWYSSIPYLQERRDTFDGPGSYSDYNTYYSFSKTFTMSQIDADLKDMGYIQALDLNYSGTWDTSSDPKSSKGTSKHSSTPGSYVEYTFTGTGISWIGLSNNSKGIAQVSIDGGEPVNVDTYSSSDTYQKTLYSINDLSSGIHTIKIEVTGNKNPASTGADIDVDAFDVTNGGQTVRYEESNSQALGIELNYISKYPSGRISNLEIDYRDVYGNIHSHGNTAYPPLSLGKDDAWLFLHLPSSLYTIVQNSDGSYTFNGSGIGHGVGLSQVGARNRAIAGQNYKQILLFYYNDATSSSDVNNVQLVSILPQIVSISGYKSDVSVNQPFTITPVVSGGSGTGYLYKYQIIKGGSTVFTQNYSTTQSLTYTPPSDGQYTINLYVKDKLSQNDYDAMGSYSVNAQGTGITSVSVNTGTIYQNVTPVNVQATADGNPASTLFKFEAYTGSTLEASQDYSAVSNFSFIPKQSGSYTIKVYEKDQSSTDSYDSEKDVTINVASEPQSWTSTNGIRVQRLAGYDRYQTAIEISKNGWPNGSPNVVLATGQDFPDALAAGPLAKVLNAPILLTYTSTLEGRVADEIKRLGAKNVYIIGSTGVVSSGVESQLRDIGITNIIRIGGKDRYETSAMIAQEIVNLTGKLNGVAVATGINFPDALSIAPFAASNDIPILLTYDTVLPSSVRSFLAGKSISKTYVIGSSGVVSDAVKAQLPNSIRLYGSDRFGTNYAVVNYFTSGKSISNFFTATGLNYPDAITASSLSGKEAAPIILTDDSVMPDTMKSFLEGREGQIKSIEMIGSSAVTPVSTLDGIAK